MDYRNVFWVGTKKWLAWQKGNMDDFYYKIWPSCLTFMNNLMSKHLGLDKDRGHCLYDLVLTCCWFHVWSIGTVSSYVSVYMCIFLCTFNLLQILLRERVVINGLFLPWMHECVFIKRENVMDKLWKKKRLRSEGVNCNAVFAWRDFNHIHCFLLHWSTSPK